MLAVLLSALPFSWLRLFGRLGSVRCALLGISPENESHEYVNAVIRTLFGQSSNRVSLRRGLEYALAQLASADWMWVRGVMDQCDQTLLAAGWQWVPGDASPDEVYANVRPAMRRDQRHDIWDDRAGEYYTVWRTYYAQWGLPKLDTSPQWELRIWVAGRSI